MGEHVKGKRAILGAILGWARAHPKVISAALVSAVGVVMTVKPDFPGNVVIGMIQAVFGA